VQPGQSPASRPASATSGRGVALGFVSLLAALLLLRQQGASAATALPVVLLAYALPIALFDLSVEKVHRRASTGLDWTLPGTRARSVDRIAVKLVGMLATFATLAGAYAMLPASVFGHYALFAGMTLPFLPVLAALGLAYIVLLDRVMVDPQDGLSEFGSLFLLRTSGRNWPLIRDHLLGWTIKGFFLPQMFGFLAGGLWQHLSSPGAFTWVDLVTRLAAFAVLAELVIVVTGYTLTLRVLDAHIRSPNPLPTAWMACLVCYFPFNLMILRPLFPYNDGMEWNDWFGAALVLAVPWGCMLVASYALWVWATAIYGLRWSNLTNRGIITGGPYRYTKHPDYLAKSAFWWLSSVPFLSVEGWQAALAHSAMLVAVNLVYYARARTEERHLRRDPTYRAYAAWIERHGLLARVRRRMPWRRPVATKPPAQLVSAASDTSTGSSR
jgi:protein-S-isoprenylcysteine O-methyltransferase Ste14